MRRSKKNLPNAVIILESLGNTCPTSKQLELMESLLTQVVVTQRFRFDERLSPREALCLFWAAKGKTSQQTATLLNISSATVESHRKQIKRKLGCMSLTQAVFEGIRWGYLQPLSANETYETDREKKQAHFPTTQGELG